jgi:hypothetical protein
MKVSSAEVELVVPDGPEVIVLSGAVVSGGGTSTVHVREAGRGSVLAAPSRARTSKTCVPFASPLYEAGELHEAHASPSMRHSKLEPGSFEENVKLAESVATVPDGPESIVVSGGIRSSDAGGFLGLGPLSGLRATI